MHILVARKETNVGNAPKGIMFAADMFVKQKVACAIGQVI